MPFIQFPDIPNVPGVPPLIRNPVFPNPALPALMFGDSSAIVATSHSSQSEWGIFKDGSLVIQTDSIVEVDFRQDWNLPTYPIEKGGFETYNKVNNPFAFQLRMSCGGSEERRAAFLANVDSIAGTTDLYDAVTPERVYSDVNFERYELHRTSTSGLGVILIDASLLQIRETATEAAFTNTKSPTSNAQVNDGTVNTTDPATPKEKQQSALAEFAGE